MLRRALRENRRSVLSFVVWAVSSMMTLSALYGVGYLPQTPLRGLPFWFLVTTVYGVVTAAGLVATNAALWSVVLLSHRRSPTATPSGIAKAMACGIGGDLGSIAAEIARSMLTKAPPELTPLWPAVLSGFTLGLMFFMVRFSVDSAARYRRLKQSTRLAQGQVLANQLKPHFLFNSLNSLAELIETDARQGAEMAQRLSELFRRISNGARHATTPLSNELSIVREYLAIEKVRLGDRLSFEVDEPIWSKERHVPTLMLQTLVENAIKHGIAPCIEGGTIRVVFRERDDVYECSVVNTGMPLKPAASLQGTGLVNSAERLRQLYGSDCKLALVASAEGTRASFWFTGNAVAQDLDR